MKNKAGLIILFASLFICANSFSGTSIPITFEELDTDANNFISKDEGKVRTDITKNWKSIDKDDNGKLDVTEYSAYEGKDRFSPPEESSVSELGAAPIE